MKVGDMPILYQLPESVGGFEAFELAQTFYRQHFLAYGLLLALQVGVGIVKILFIGNGITFTM